MTHLDVKNAPCREPESDHHVERSKAATDGTFEPFRWPALTARCTKDSGLPGGSGGLLGACTSGSGNSSATTSASRQQSRTSTTTSTSRVAAATIATVLPRALAEPEACRQGVGIEQADVALYDELLPQVQNHADLTKVLTTLRAASQENHLPAFDQCADPSPAKGSAGTVR
jgi:hypothetical protein